MCKRSKKIAAKATRAVTVGWKRFKRDIPVITEFARLSNEDENFDAFFIKYVDENFNLPEFTELLKDVKDVSEMNKDVKVEDFFEFSKNLAFTRAYLLKDVIYRYKKEVLNVG